MCNRKRSKGHKSVESGIKTSACQLAAEFVSFKIDHPCLKTDTFSKPESKFTTMNFAGQGGQTIICNNNYLAGILKICVINDLI